MFFRLANHHLPRLVSGEHGGSLQVVIKRDEGFLITGAGD